MHQQTCIQPQVLAEETSDSVSEEATLPSIDIFINPEKKNDRDIIIKIKQDVAKNYFKTSNMRSLYPNLFRILWESTLPCFGETNLC